jgi:hypothetical protein
MTLSYQPKNDWCAVATIELADSFDRLADLLSDASLEFRIERVAKAPPDRAWFHLLVDLSKGERRGARTAYALLTTLKYFAASGDLPTLRIVSGEQWLRLSDIHVGLDARRAGIPDRFACA